MKLSRSTCLLMFALTSVVALTFSSAAAAQQVYPIFVDNQATGANDGSSWHNAYLFLDVAIANASSPNNIIFVRQSSIPYKPPHNGYSSGGFVINHSVRLYGGFYGDESTLSQRHGVFNNTVLDGDWNGQGIHSQFASHVIDVQSVTGTSGSPGVIIDGFQIRNGYAWNLSTNQVGGGILATCSDIRIANCLVTQNNAHDGGGLYFNGCENINPTLVSNLLQIKSCTFTSNSSDLVSGQSTSGHGGGLWAAAVYGELVNTSFQSNQSYLEGAGAQIDYASGADYLNFTNCLFWSNTCSYASTAAGLNLSAANSAVVNCTFADNLGNSSTSGTAYGQGLYIGTSSVVGVYNSILWFNHTGTSALDAIGYSGTVTVGYSDVETAGLSWPGSNNKRVDPAFRGHSLGILTLAVTSQCIDCADYSQLPLDDLDVNNDGNVSEVIPLDDSGLPRLVDYGSTGGSGNGGHSCGGCTYLDMGAYEHPQ